MVTHDTNLKKQIVEKNLTLNKTFKKQKLKKNCGKEKYDSNPKI